MVTLFQGLHAIAHLLDDSSALAADNGRQWHRIQTAAVVDIDVVQAYGGMAQQHLACGGLRNIDVFDLKGLWPTGGVDENCFTHAFSSASLSYCDSLPTRRRAICSRRPLDQAASS